MCKNEKIDIMFDDVIDTCESLCDNGRDAVVFNSKLIQNVRDEIVGIKFIII